MCGHYIMECPLYNNQRNELQKTVGARNFRLERLLGQRKYLEHTLQYVNATNRFSNVQEWKYEKETLLLRMENRGKSSNLKKCMEKDVKCWNADQLPVYS